MTRARSALGFVIVAALALAAGYWAGLYFKPAAPPVAGEGASGAFVDFSLPDLSGRTRRLEEWRGQPLVLNFWATWCPPCREEIPLLIDAQKRYTPAGVRVVGVALDQPEPVNDYARRFGINYPVLIADDNTLDVMTRYGNVSGALPYTVLIDAEGRVRSVKLGAFQRKELEELIDRLLPTPP